MPKIEIVKDRRWRGSKTIKVDGEPWGQIQMAGHGVHGVSYDFYQIEGVLENGWPELSAIKEEQQSVISPYRTSKVAVKVWSSKRARFMDANRGRPVASLEARLLLKAEVLVALRLLVSPDEIKLIEETRREAREAEDRTEKERAEQKLRSHARGIMAMIQTGRPFIANEVENAIVEAMRWAQRQ